MTLLSKLFAAPPPNPQAPPRPAALPLFEHQAIEQVLALLGRLPDPDEVLAQRGLGRHELRKLEIDDEISAALETRREAVIATPWRLEPFEGEAAEWLWAQLEPHIEPLLRGAWSAVPYGFSVMEVVYSPGKRIGLSQIQEKPLEWFEPKRDGSLWFTPPMGGLPVEVDRTYKFLLSVRQPTYRNPYGEALLSRLYWPWFFRHNGWRFWMAWLERFAEPLLLGQVYSPEAFVRAMDQLGMTSVVGVGREEVVSAVIQGQSGEFERVEAALVARIQKLILGQTLTSQVGASGSYAAAKVHNTVREDKRRADLRLVTSTVQHLVDALWSLNRLPGTAPAFILQDDQGLESERATRDAALVNAGILTFTEQYLLSKYDLVPGDFELPQAAPVPPALEAPEDDGGEEDEEDDTDATLEARAHPSRTFATKPQRFTQDQQLVEDLVDSALAAARSPIAPERLRAVIAKAESPEDLAERLAALYTGTEDVAFQELLERSLFAADVLGYVTAEKRVGVTP